MAYKVDNCISQVNRAIFSREGHDIVVLFSTDAVRLLAVLAKMFSKLPHGTSPGAFKRSIGSRVMSTLVPMSRHCATAAHKVSSRLGLLAAILDEWQFLGRLWGLLDTCILLRELIRNYLTSNSDETPSIATLDFSMSIFKLFSLASYYLCEATALLSSKGVFGFSIAAQEKLFRISGLSWVVFSFTEVATLLLQLLQSSEVGKVCTRITEDNEWRREVCRNLAWAVLGLHWSSAGQLFSEETAALLSFLTSWSYMKDLWTA